MEARIRRTWLGGYEVVDDQGAVVVTVDSAREAAEIVAELTGEGDEPASEGFLESLISA